jgi:hypothetical protein
MVRPGHHGASCIMPDHAAAPENAAGNASCGEYVEG